MRQRMMVRRQKVTTSAHNTSIPGLALQRKATDGQPSDLATHASGEPILLGHDFSRIRVHKEDKLGTSLQLSASVGKNGQNLPADLERVQTRLNLLGFAPGEIDGRYSSHTEDAILAFQQFFLKSPDGLIEVGSFSHNRLNQLQGPAEAKTPKPTAEGKEADIPEQETQQNAVPRFRIKRDKDFLQSLDGKSIESKLLQTVETFCQHLILNDYVSGDIVLLEGMRDAKKAHRWSTAYSIRNDRVSLEALQALPNGRDRDGNQWYKEKETMAQAKRRAADLGLSSPSTVASEGYPTGDPKTAPNTWDKGISNYLIGKALKVLIPWSTKKGGGLNDPVANALIKEFGLKRPVKNEPQHFELLQGSPEGDEEFGRTKD